jgi:hypothetical protein
MSIADEAVENSLQFEAVKYAYRQNKEGVVISFVVHPNDIPAALSTSHIGARYVAVLVQIGDDEKPIPLKAKENKTPHVVTPATPRRLDKPAGAKRDWRALPKPQQAGIRIGEATFAAYLREEHPHDWRETGEVDACLKFMCGINSKRELATNAQAGALWFQIDSGYQAWLAKERVGA